MVAQRLRLQPLPQIYQGVGPDVVTPWRWNVKHRLQTTARGKWVGVPPLVMAG